MLFRETHPPLRVQKLSRKDLADLRRIINRAREDKKVLEGLLSRRLPDDVKKPSELALEALWSLTRQELTALSSIFAKMEAAGADRRSLEAIIF